MLNRVIFDLHYLNIEFYQINILITLAASYQSIGEFEKSKKTIDKIHLSVV